MPSALSRDSGQSLIMIDEIMRKKNKPNEMLVNESKCEPGNCKWLPIR
jgi:hypothetical protein